MSPSPDDDRSPIQREVEAELDKTVPGTTVIEHLGRRWRIPLKRHFRHLSAMRTQMVSGYGSWDLLIAETFLSDRLYDDLPAGQVTALWDLNPTEEDLAELTKKIAEALGLENTGN